MLDRLEGWNMRITETKMKDVVKNRNLDLVATLLEMVQEKSWKWIKFPRSELEKEKGSNERRKPWDTMRWRGEAVNEKSRGKWVAPEALGNQSWEQLVVQRSEWPQKIRDGEEARDIPLRNMKTLQKDGVEKGVWKGSPWDREWRGDRKWQSPWGNLSVLSASGHATSAQPGRRCDGKLHGC